MQFLAFCTEENGTHGCLKSYFHVQQRCMFAEYFGRDVFVYLDDIIIYAKTCSLLSAVLSILHKAKLFCKCVKCVFSLPVEMLGQVVSRGLQMSERR